MDYARPSTSRESGNGEPDPLLDSESFVADNVRDCAGSESDSPGELEMSESDDESDADVRPNPKHTAKRAPEWLPTAGIVPAADPFPFVGTPGPTSVMLERFADNPDPLELFKFYFNPVLMDKIVEETNRYANQHLANAVLRRRSRLLEWHNVVLGELWIWLALVIQMGVVQKPTIQNFWSRNELLDTPFFRHYMTERRFLLLSKFLHFQDNVTTLQEKDNHPCWRLNKIWPVFQSLQESFRAAFMPSVKISIDESLLKYRGRLCWRQFIPSKRARYGIKLYMLCDCDTGYIWTSIVYTGKGMALGEKWSKESQTAQIVLTLSDLLLDRGHCLVMDNYYMSPYLSDLLVTRKTDSYGTVKVNRKGLPVNFKCWKVKKGDVVAWRRDKLLALKWRDKKDVTMLSTIHTSNVEEVQVQGKPVIKPKLVLDYNDSMGGVDKADQNLSYYDSLRKGTKCYYKKLFRHLVDQTLYNAFIIHQQLGGKYKTLLNFRMAVVKSIIAEFFDAQVKQPVKPGRQLTGATQARLHERHFPDTVPSTSCTKNAMRRCVVCARKKDSSGKKMRRESRYQCSSCNVALCVDPCFRLYHTLPEV
jgi:hypothetical protein